MEKASLTTEELRSLKLTGVTLAFIVCPLVIWLSSDVSLFYAFFYFVVSIAFVYDVLWLLNKLL